MSSAALSRAVLDVLEERPHLSADEAEVTFRGLCADCQLASADPTS